MRIVSVLPNDKDKLPGRLQDLHAARNQDGGPVSFIRWFCGYASDSGSSFP
jgi:hypothetical protein